MIQTNRLTLPQQAKSIALSTPVQSGLYLSLAALTLWTVFFTTSPAVHDKLHSARHHLLTVSCH